jgi:hypothetical protein
MNDCSLRSQLVPSLTLLAARLNLTFPGPVNLSTAGVDVATEVTG